MTKRYQYRNLTLFYTLHVFQGWWWWCPPVMTSYPAGEHWTASQLSQSTRDSTPLHRRMVLYRAAPPAAADRTLSPVKQLWRCSSIINNNNKHIQHLGGTRNPPQQYITMPHNHQHQQEHHHAHYTADDNDNDNDNDQECVPARMVSVAAAAVYTLGHRYSTGQDRRTTSQTITD